MVSYAQRPSRARRAANPFLSQLRASRLDDVTSSAYTPRVTDAPQGPSFPLRTVDIMCGAGGLSLGFAGTELPSGEPAFSIEYGVDIDDDCMATYRRNLFSERPVEEQRRRGAARSVVGLRGAEIMEAAGAPSIGALIGGPNCQAVSTAGLRNPDDQRNQMFREYHRLVAELRPRWFVMENVPGIVHANALPLLLEVLTALESIDGYEVAGEVLLAADHAVSQYRYRLFVVGTRTGLPIRFPAPTHFRTAEPRHRTVRDAIGLEVDGGPQAASSDAVDPVNVRRIKCVPPGGDWRDIPVRLLPERNFWVRSSDQRGAYGRLAWDEPAYTITGLFGNVTAGRFTHPTEHRPLLPVEAARLQGFFSDFVLEGRRQSWPRQLGNAVPPPLARAVAETIVRSEIGLSDEHGDVPGRLDVETVKAVIEGRARLPTMTPRLSRRHAARPRVGTPRTTVAGAKVRPVDVEAELARLRTEAEMVGHRWTAKRARAVLGAREGKDVATLATELRTSERSVARWIANYETDGPEGWRAYHTPIERMGGDAATRQALRRGVEAARRWSDAAGSRLNRPLQGLVDRFGDFSVNDLLDRLRSEAGVEPGTVYVGDLLAIADVLLGDARRGVVDADVPEAERGVAANA